MSELIKPEIRLIPPGLQKTLNEKSAFIDNILNQFEKDFGKISQTILVDLRDAYGNGQWSYDTVMGIFQNAGYDDAIQGYVEQYSETMKFIKREAQYSGLSFALTEKGLDLAGMFQEQNLAKLMKIKEMYAQTMVETGVKHSLEDVPFNKLVEELQKGLDGLWRNSKIEVSEGIKVFDRFIHGEQMKEAGIALFVYVGPDDEVTRESCHEVLNDPRQETGWSREEIDDSPVSFITGGGWNCRHDWMPYMEGF